MPYSDPEKQRGYQRRWIAKRRADWLADKSCVDCGSTDDLEIDHVDRSTKVTHRVWSWAEARREQELAKCVVRCADCHTLKTIPEWQEINRKVSPENMSWCIRCKSFLSRERFSANRSRWNGLHTVCKGCDHYWRVAAA